MDKEVVNTPCTRGVKSECTWIGASDCMEQQTGFASKGAKMNLQSSTCAPHAVLYSS